MRTFVAISLLFVGSTFAQSQPQKHPFTFEDMMKLKRVDEPVPSPDGKNIVFVSAINSDCKDDACNKQRDEELKKSKVKAKIFTKLFYRHWNAFTEFKRSHLFVQSVEAGVSPAGTTNAAETAAAT